MSTYEGLARNKEHYWQEHLWESRKGVFTEPPKRTPSDTFVDGPLMGNGDVGIVIGGPAEGQAFYIGKNDFWTQAHLGETWEQRIDRLLNDHGRRTGTGMTTIGHLRLEIPQLKGASYYREQDLRNAEVRGTFEKDAVRVKMCSWVCAVSNLLVTEISYEWNGGEGGAVSKDPCDLEITAVHHVGTPRTQEVFNYENSVTEELMWFKYAANPTHVPENRRVGVATRVLGVEAQYKDRFQTCQAVLKLQPGEKAAFVTSIITNLDEKDFMEFSKNMVRSLDAEKVALLNREHRKWWKGFWNESFIDIGDPVLEKFYYGSNYILASSMRKGKVPPGLFGNWITTDRPKWTGSYTLNYNYESPYWGLYTGNHMDITESYCEPPLDAIPLGKIFAKEFLGHRGIYYPVEMGPWGTFCSMAYHDQKSNAAYCAVNMVMHFYHTYDMEYARKIYPYLLEVGEFWEDDLVFEEGRYSILNDSIHERSMDKKNPIYSMGLVQMVFKALLDIGRELEIYQERYEKWQHILNHFSPYPLHEVDGMTVFRYTEEGMAWGRANTVGTQHIYPAGQIGFDSDPALLRIARNTVHAMQRWTDHNAFPTYYTTAARVGYDPAVILEKLREECCAKSFPSLAIHHGGGGIEDSNAVPSCLHEMLLQSYEGVLRLFPVWPENRDARFGTLRAVGAFLVSSEYKEGRVQYVLVESEKGRACTLQNPWGEDAVLLTGSTGRKERLTGARFTFTTSPGEQLQLIPESY